MAKRKSLVHREADGRVQRGKSGEGTHAAAEVKRLRDAGMVDVRHAEWGTMLGWLFLKGTVSAVQYAAGKRWAELASENGIAMQGPRPPRSAQLQQGAAGSTADPSSGKGIAEARRHVKAMDQWAGGSAILKHAGAIPSRVVREVCENNRLPVGHDETVALGIGLTALAVFWKMK